MTISTSQPSIPTIDISPLLSITAPSTVRQAVITSMSDAAHTYGFFNLTGHGIPQSSLAEALTLNKMFFALPESSKMDVAIEKSVGRAFRGYERPGIQTHQEGVLPDIKETFMVGREVGPEDPDCGSFSTGPNLWPEDLEAERFRERVMEYQAQMVQLVRKILEILALGLPKEWACSPDVFEPLLKQPSIPMRFLHYAPVEKQDERQFGVADHTDFGFVSILLQDANTTGLQVFYPPTATWVPVPVIPDGFVINMGDMMEKYTGGYYRSARHRVITSRDQHRHSVAFFLNGDLRFNAKALDGSGAETLVGEQIQQRLIETMGETGKLLRRELVQGESATAM